MKNIFFISFLLILGLNGFGQNTPKVFIQTKNNINDYESQGMNHSTHLILNDDSSFVYYSVYEVGYKLSIGYYSLSDNQIVLNTNIKNTYNAISDSLIYSKYYKQSTPSPFQLKDTKYEIKKDSLILITY